MRLYRSFLPIGFFLLGSSAAYSAKDSRASASWPAAEWRKAGITPGGLEDLSVIAKLHPGDDLQAAIEAAPSSGGVILLASGDYPLTATLKLRSNLVLRGADRVKTRLVIQMRGLRPATPIAADTTVWTTGVRLQGIERSGLEELTVMLDPSLPPPIPQNQGRAAFKDNPFGRKDLHVVSVCLDDARECRITKCLILNAGTHPVVIANSHHVTVEEVEIEGTYNRGVNSGEFSVIRSEYTLLEKVRMNEINSMVIMGGEDEPDCRYNVLSNSRLEVDVRVHGYGAADNLIENCAIALDKWMERTPLSPGNVNAREAPPGPGNLVYFCTITRDFGGGQRSFSMADNPGMIYEIIQFRARDREASVSDFAPAPPTGSLMD